MTSNAFSVFLNFIFSSGVFCNTDALSFLSSTYTYIHLPAATHYADRSVDSIAKVQKEEGDNGDKSRKVREEILAWERDTPPPRDSQSPPRPQAAKSRSTSVIRTWDSTESEEVNKEKGIPRGTLLRSSVLPSATTFEIQDGREAQ